MFSAGLRDVIEEALALATGEALTSTTLVVSNRMLWSNGSDAKLIGFSEPLIHMFNKNQSAVPLNIQKRYVQRPFLPQAPPNSLCSASVARRNAILLGDGIGDVTMIDGARNPPKVVLAWMLLQKSNVC